MDALSTQISSRKFSAARRGYDRAEVDRYLQMVGALVAKLEDELRVTRSRIDALERQTRDVREADTVVQTAFLAAADSKAKLMAEAEAKASALIAEAQARAERMVQASHEGAGREAEALLVEARRKLAESEELALARRLEAEQEAQRILEAARQRSQQADVPVEPAPSEAGAELQRLMETLGALRQVAREGIDSRQDATADEPVEVPAAIRDDRGI